MEIRSILKDAKGQAALEYMMTYGWAILVVLIIGLVLWQMGIFNQQSTPPGCSGFSQIVALDSKLDSSTNRLQLVISNEAGMRLNVSGITATLNSESISGSVPGTMRPGVSRDVNFTFTGSVRSQDYYRVNVIIEYTNILSGIDHKSSGDCWGTIQ